jgi:serine/threonine protein kinase
VFYYAMEYIEGRSLQQLLTAEGPQPAGRVVHVLLQAAGSLREAHGVGLIHRDIKPGNLLIGTRAGMPDFVKVIDFGLAKQLEPQDDMFVTRTDALAGTPLFMAPETILRPDQVDGKVDTYALGALAYMLITGAPPFAGATVVEVCSHHLQTQPVPPSQRGVSVPADLEALILRCLAKLPEQRPDDEELLQLLRACQETSPWSERVPDGGVQPRAAAQG